MRWVLPVVLLCVSVDFSNPLLPGSQRLDPSESVYGVLANPSRVMAEAPKPTPLLEPGGAVRERAVISAAAVAPAPLNPGGQRPAVRHLHRSRRDPPAPSEDH